MLCRAAPGVFDLRPALEAAAAGGILNARQLEGVATSVESAFELKAAAAAADTSQQQQRQQFMYPCLAQLASDIQDRELQTLQAIRSCIRYAGGAHPPAAGHMCGGVSRPVMHTQLSCAALLPSPVCAHSVVAPHPTMSNKPSSEPVSLTVVLTF